MNRTILLMGRSLELAREIEKTAEAANTEARKLREAADAVIAANSQRIGELRAEILQAEGLSSEMTPLLDLTYLSEHGMAFVICAGKATDGQLPTPNRKVH